MDGLFQCSYRLASLLAAPDTNLTTHYYTIRGGEEGHTMTERTFAGRYTRRIGNVPSEEWLGGESHMPSLNRELRRRDRSISRSSFGWAVFSIFVAGLALGSVITLLSTSRRPLS